MVDNYLQTTVAPTIPSELVTERLKELCHVTGISSEVTKKGDIYFYAKEGIIYNEDEDGNEVGEEEIVKELREIIKNSSGTLPWVCLESAYTCSKMRQGEFGGSAVFITADEVRYISTSSWLMVRISEIETKNHS